MTPGFLHGNVQQVRSSCYRHPVGGGQAKCLAYGECGSVRLQQQRQQQQRRHHTHQHQHHMKNNHNNSITKKTTTTTTTTHQIQPSTGGNSNARERKPPQNTQTLSLSLSRDPPSHLMPRVRNGHKLRATAASAGATTAPPVPARASAYTHSDSTTSIMVVPGASSRSGAANSAPRC